MKFKKFTLLFIMLFGTFIVQAQDLEAHKSFGIGLDLGFNKAYTDITQYPLFPTFTNKGDLMPSIGLHIRKSLSAAMGLQLNLNYDPLQGVLRVGSGDGANSNDYHVASRRSRLNRFFGGKNTYFKSPTFSAGLDAHINISNLDVHYRENGHRKYIYYLVVGVSGVFYNPDIRSLQGDVAFPEYQVLKDAKINQEKHSAMAVRGGFGVKRNMSSKIDLGFEMVGNFAQTDYLDGIDVRSNGNDIFWHTRFTLSYKLASKTAGVETNLIDWMNPGQQIITDMKNMNARIDSLASVMDNSFGTADSDGDGVYDVVDKEPYTPFGAKVDADGKGIDSDADGVYDGLDKEPNTPAGKLVNFQGIEIKTSTGGTDKPAINPGTTATTAEAYFPSLFFETGSARIRSLDVDKLVRIATAMQQNPSLKVKVVGNADVRGGTEFNQNLAKNRADAVRDYLVKNLGVDSGRITIESKGKSDPLSPTLNDVNRRVDVMGTK
jgi:outer membrane protein OmpA-like peptidoglycan-associated protein